MLFKWKIISKSQAELCAADKGKEYFKTLDQTIARYIDKHGESLWEALQIEKLKESVTKDDFKRVLYWATFSSRIALELMAVYKEYHDDSIDILWKSFQNCTPRGNRKVFSKAVDNCIVLLKTPNKQYNEISILFSSIQFYLSCLRISYQFTTQEDLTKLTNIVIQLLPSLKEEGTIASKMSYNMMFY